MPKRANHRESFFRRVEQEVQQGPDVRRKFVQAIQKKLDRRVVLLYASSEPVPGAMMDDVDADMLQTALAGARSTDRLALILSSQGGFAVSAAPRTPPASPRRQR